MHCVAFDACCGMMIISRFKDTYMEGAKLSEVQKTQLKDYLLGIIKVTTNVGMVIAAINDFQVNDGIQDVLLNCGFKDLTGPFHHPGHGHRITLFGYEHHPSKREAPAPWDYLRKTVKKTYKGKSRPVKKRVFG